MRKKAVLSYIKRHEGEIFWFVVPPLIALIYYAVKGVFIYLGPDAELYYSIAENFRTTGHFIQTARDSALFVVPFGVPLILTVLRLIGFTLPMIIAIQYLMFGTACMLLYKTERILFGRGGFAPVFYSLALLRARIDLYDIYLEHYFLLLIILLLYLSVRRDMPVKKRLIYMNLAGMYMVACRPVLLPVYIAVLIYSLVLLVRRQLPVGRFAIFLLIPVLLFGANTLVNYRETGYPIVMDSYSGRDFYAANNPEASAGYYSSKIYESFGEEYTAVQNDPTLDRVQKNELFKKMGTKWVMENPELFQCNTAKRFAEDFVWTWRYTLILCFFGAMHMIAACPDWRRWAAVTLAVNLVVAVITAMGLVMVRYTAVVWPLAALHLSAITHPTLKRLKERFSRKRKINA